MSITVADCLKLPSLREAEVIGGHKGLSNIVSYVTVLEYADFSVLEDVWVFLGNEMVISALVSIKDDVEAQLRIIQRLHDMGEACLVIYYTGIHILKVDERLTKLADGLGFPLIVMSPNCYGHRYSDAISEVMYAIFSDQQQEENILASLLEQIARIKPYLRNIGAAMRIFSDRFRCSLLLTDRNGDIRAFAPWPRAAQWNEHDLGAIIGLRRSETHSIGSAALAVGGRDVSVHSLALDTEKQRGLLLYAIDESGAMNEKIMLQVIETLQLFLSIWKTDFELESADALVRAILNNQSGEMRRIARQLCIDVESLNTMWVFWNKQDRKDDAGKSGKERLAARLAGFLKDSYGAVVVDIVEDYVVAFLGTAKYPSLDAHMAGQFVDESKCGESGWVLFSSSGLSDAEEVRANFLLMEENIDAACRILRRNTVITRHELKLAEKCRRVLAAGETEVKGHMLLLEPLLQDVKGGEAIETLAALLLDCQCSVAEAANQLFVHKNTLKYRIKKANSALGFDVTKMPEMTDLYFALALARMMP